MTSTKEINSLSFEEALAELQEIVKNIESGKDKLENIIANYERGNALRKHCEMKLNEAKLRVDKIVENTDDGSISLE